MRIIAPLCTVAAAVVFLVVVYWNWPQPTTYEVRKPVWETGTRTVKKLVAEVVMGADGRPRTVHKAVDYTIPIKTVKFVPETRTEPVTKNQTLQCGALTLIGVILIAYAGIILTAFTGLLFWNVPDKEHAKTIEVQLAFLIAFASGIAATYFGIILNPSHNDELKLLREQLSTLQSVIEGMSPSSSDDAYSTPYNPSPDRQPSDNGGLRLMATPPIFNGDELTPRLDQSPDPPPTNTDPTPAEPPEPTLAPNPTQV